jgi:hypothetical protein
MQAQHSRVPMPSLCSQHLPPPASRLGFTFLLEVTGRDSFLCFGFVTNINNLYFLCPENCFPHIEIRTVNLPCIRLARCNHLVTSHPGLGTPLPFLAPTHPRHLLYITPSSPMVFRCLPQSTYIKQSYKLCPLYR